MAKGPQRFLDGAGHALRALVVWISAAESDIGSSPRITAGAAAPTAADVKGSQYLRTGDGSTYYNTDGSTDWQRAGELQVIAAADAAAIAVTHSFSLAITTGGSGETNTCAIPAFAGQRAVITLDVDGGGDRVITFASGINVGADTIATFATARQTLVLVGIQIAGVLAWEVEANIGTVVLS